MSIFENILQILENNQISYKLIEHEPVFTMEQAAKVCSHKPVQGVKTLLAKLYSSKRQFDYWLVVWQGNEQIIFDELTSQQSYKKWKFAQPDEVLFDIGVEVGALAPFGYVQKYPTIFDKRLLEQEQVYINAGVHDKTIALAPRDLFQILEQFSSKCIQY